MLHRFHEGTKFNLKRQLAELDLATSSRAAATTLAENHVGMPLKKSTPLHPQGDHEPTRPEAPQTRQALLKHVGQARQLGYSVAIGTYYEWMAAIAAPVRHPVRGDVIGIVSIAGPNTRLTKNRLQEIGPLLLAAAAELSTIMPGSPALSHRAGSSPAVRLERCQRLQP